MALIESWEPTRSYVAITAITPMCIWHKQLASKFRQFATFPHLDAKNKSGVKLHAAAQDPPRSTDCRWAWSNAETLCIHINYSYVCLEAWSGTYVNAKCSYVGTVLVSGCICAHFSRNLCVLPSRGQSQAAYGRT